MVQRKKLALIALLVSILFTVFAEETDNFSPIEIIQKVEPTFPEDRILDYKIKIDLEVYISPSAEILDIVVISKPTSLDSLAINNVKLWTFKPATKNGENIVSKTNVSVIFDPDRIYKSLTDEITKPDTIDYNIQELTSDLNEFNEKLISNRKQIRKQNNVYYENFHNIGFDIDNKIFLINGFSQTPTLFYQYHDIGNYIHFYEYNTNNNLIKMNSFIYHNPIPMTYSFIGLGAYKHDFAEVSFYKKNILFQKNLSLQLNLITHDGVWQQQYESGTNYNLNLTYNTLLGDISWNTNRISQKASNLYIKSPFRSEETTLDESKLNHQIKFTNKYITLGYAFSEIDLSYPESNKFNSKSEIFLLEKDLKFFNQKIYLNAQYITSKADTLKDCHDLLFLCETNNKMGKLSIDQIFQSGFQYDYFYQNETSFQLTENFKPFINIYGKQNKSNYLNYMKFKKENSANLGFHLNTGFSNTKLTCGYRNVGFDDHDEFFVSAIENEISFPIDSLKVTLYSKLDYFDINNDSSLPEYALYTDLIFSYKLKHNNAINLGFSLNKIGDYYDSTGELIYVPETTILDGFLEIEITDRFSIWSEGKNFLDNENLLEGSPLYLHYNTLLRWTFYN